MKSSTTLTLLAIALAAPLAHADVANRVTLTGKITTASDAITQQTANSTKTTSKLLSESVTNSTILDALVFTLVISEKKGHTIVEVFDDLGTSKGFYVSNTHTGELTKLSEGLIGTFTGSKLVTANTSTTRTTGSNSTTTTSSSFTGVASTVVGNIPLTAYLSGTTASRSKTVRSGGETTVSPYLATTYTATLGGVNSEGTGIYSGKLVSTGSSFIPTDLP